MATVNLATKYSNKVDERFEKQSQASLVTSGEYEFTGVKTVKVYSINTVDVVDYARDGMRAGEKVVSRYGDIDELGNAVQEMTVSRDRSWTFTIDKGNYTQSQMVMNAGKACSRQIAQKIIPEYDTYVFGKIARAAYNGGAALADGANHFDATTPAKTGDNSAYGLFLKGQEVLGDALVPDAGRVALCSYKFANLLKQDSSFMKYGDRSQEMLVKGVIGEVDGTKIVMVPASRLPAGTNFILTHPMACVAPKQLWEYKIHTDAPGISGWLCEGRVIYDAFVLDNKAVATYYCGPAITD